MGWEIGECRKPRKEHVAAGSRIECWSFPQHRQGFGECAAASKVAVEVMRERLITVPLPPSSSVQEQQVINSSLHFGLSE